MLSCKDDGMNRVIKRYNKELSKRNFLLTKYTSYQTEGNTNKNVREYTLQMPQSRCIILSR